jgi:arylsulfatase A-like enzyme
MKSTRLFTTTMLAAVTACAFVLPAAQAQQAATGPGVTAAKEPKPNIVLVLMDNLGWGELGVYGGGVLRGAATPRIDKLAAEGTRLLNFNVEAQCTPSRACLLTGRYAVRTGNGSVPIDTPLYGLVQWEYTMAEMLSDAGYATGMFGKWHSAIQKAGCLSTRASMSGLESRTPRMNRSGPTIHSLTPSPIPTPSSRISCKA